MDQDDDPPQQTLAALTESLEQSRADLAAGRIVSGDVVFARINALIAGITDENRHDPIDMGPATGREVW